MHAEAEVYRHEKPLAEVVPERDVRDWARCGESPYATHKALTTQLCAHVQTLVIERSVGRDGLGRQALYIEPRCVERLGCGPVRKRVRRAQHKTQRQQCSDSQTASKHIRLSHVFVGSPTHNAGPVVC